MDRKREVRRVDYLPESFEVGRLHSGEMVIGDLDNDPDITVPDNDFANRAGYRNTELVAEALSWMDSAGEGYNGEYIVRSYEFDANIGVNDCIETNDNDEIIYAIRSSKRKKRKLPTRFVIAREGLPTRKLTFILQRQLPNNPETLSIVAAWMGPLAKPEPVGIYNTPKNRRFWQRHALALRDLKQIDTTQPIRSTNRRQEISVRNLEDLFNETERVFSVEQTTEHMRTGEFGARYVQMASQRESRSHLFLDETAGQEAGELAERDIELFAAVCLVKQLSSTAEPFKYWKLILPDKSRKVNLKGWGKLLTYARREVSQEPGGNVPLKKRLARAYLSQIMTGPTYVQTAERDARVQRAAAQATHEVNELMRELDSRKNEPAFIEAASAWTNAPDSDGNIGPSGRAFSGGLVHFFEYRSGLTKRERFKTIDEPMSVDGFIAFTNRLKEQVDVVETLLSDRLLGQSGEASDNYIVALQDKNGNKRFYILRPNKDLILAYQKPGQTIKLTTMMTDSSEEYVDKVVNESQNGRDRGRLNKLGPEVRCILRYYPPKPNQKDLAA